MRIFSGVPVPFWDETLTSWLARLSQEQFVNINELQRCFTEYAQSVVGDLDLLYASSGFLDDLPPFLTNGIHRIFELPSVNLTPFNRSNLYCPQCIQLDIANLRTPGWRRAWRIEGACICYHHDRPVLLRRLEEPRFNAFNKSWLAFGEFVASPAAHINVDFALAECSTMKLRTRNRILLHLAARVQHWYQHKVCLGLERRLLPASARFLLYIWLWEDEQTTDVSGVACQYMQPIRGRNRISAPRRSKDCDAIFSTAAVRHLVVAYWFLGIAHGIITEHEAQFIKAVTRSSTLEFPTNIVELSHVGRSTFSSDTMQLIRYEAMTALSAAELQQVEWTLA